MPGLIQKSGFIKPRTGGGHYAEYIATREGVELFEAPTPRTRRQRLPGIYGGAPPLPRSVFC